MDNSYPVVIVGAGPVGVTAATLLAQYGIRSLILDRWAGVYPQPRAVHLDDEVYRILGRLGIADEFAAISRPGLGLRLLDPNLQVLAEFRRDPARSRHGHPEANMFDQPVSKPSCAPTSPATGMRDCAGTPKSSTSPTSPTGAAASDSATAATTPNTPWTATGCSGATGQTAWCAGTSVPPCAIFGSSSAGWSSTSTPPFICGSGAAFTRSAIRNAPEHSCKWAIRATAGSSAY